tara:strand:- start:245 stop:808 length:564 start_codon:yes stop_codon:yes gene_type:complete
MVFGDGASKILNVFPDIAFNDYGIFVGDAGRDDAMRQSITQLSQAALSSGQITLLDIIKVSKADTMTEAERVLEQGLDAAKKLSQEQQAQQQEAMQMQAQQEEMSFQRETQLKQMDNEAKIQVAQIQSETDLAVAEINDEQKRDVADMKEKLSFIKQKEKSGNAQANASGRTNDPEALEKIKDKISE